MKPGVGPRAAKPSDGRTVARRTIPALKPEHYETHRDAYDAAIALGRQKAGALTNAADALRSVLAAEMPKAIAAADLRPGDLVEVWWHDATCDTGQRFRVVAVEALDYRETRITGPGGSYHTEDLFAVYLLDRPVDKKTLLLQEAAAELAKSLHTPNAVDTSVFILERLTALARKMEQLEITEGQA